MWSVTLFFFYILLIIGWICIGAFCWKTERYLCTTGKVIPVWWQWQRFWREDWSSWWHLKKNSSETPKEIKKPRASGKPFYKIVQYMDVCNCINVQLIKILRNCYMHKDSQGDFEKYISLFRHNQLGMYSITTYVMFTYVYEFQLSSLWTKKDTEVVVSVLPTQTKGQTIIIHHSELRTLRPHQWLTGEVYFYISLS